MSKYRQKGQRRRHDAALRHTRVLCIASFMAALSFLIGLIAKTLQGAGPLRFTLEGLPIVFAGMALGPFYGTLVGVSADLLSCLLAGQAPLPLITIGAGMIGFIPGVLGRILFKPKKGDKAVTVSTRLTAARPRFITLLLCDGMAHLVGSIIIKTAALMQFYGITAVILWRTPLYVAIILIETYMLYILLGSQAVRRELERQIRT